MKCNLEDYLSALALPGVDILAEDNQRDGGCIYSYDALMDIYIRLPIPCMFHQGARMGTGLLCSPQISLARRFSVLATSKSGHSSEQLATLIAFKIRPSQSSGKQHGALNRAQVQVPKRPAFKYSFPSYFVSLLIFSTLQNSHSQNEFSITLLAEYSEKQMKQHKKSYGTYQALNVLLSYTSF